MIDGDEFKASAVSVVRKMRSFSCHSKLCALPEYFEGGLSLKK